MRALFLFCAALMAMGSLGYAQDQPLRGVYAPPGWTPPAAKSGSKATAAPDYGGAIGNGPRVTISGAATGRGWGVTKSSWVSAVRRVEKPWGHEEHFALVDGRSG